MFQSTKHFSGYSCCFRQWKASHSHCRFLHGYALSFRVVFEGERDARGWVCDFGCFGKNGVKARLKELFDHTTIIAKDDPALGHFQQLETQGLLQLRVVDAVGAENFAKLVCEEINRLLLADAYHANRVQAIRVDCFENETNSARYFLKS